MPVSSLHSTCSALFSIPLMQLLAQNFASIVREVWTAIRKSKQLLRCRSRPAIPRPRFRWLFSHRMFDGFFVFGTRFLTLHDTS